ncbi:hypothetical protein BDP27DRAFT_1327540 [Rhodocollybia butyracea]|uniref:Uncharacterized protein n=1 Tax=Rhodocollybia butyracea TaxID=206335 RepID=A0A9P5PTF3_9AGAR|nr:hypothetical protein BDP27DRAFT_1327540 [Rhodocollybia butyracea]
MRFGVLYASVLLAASISCIWATPIVVNRGTPIKGRDLSSSATEVHSFVARGADPHPPTPKRIPNGMGPAGFADTTVGEVISFRFTTMISGADEGEMKEKARRFMLLALPDVKFPQIQGSYKESEEAKSQPESSKESITFKVTVKMSNGLVLEYDGYMMNARYVPQGRPWVKAVPKPPKGKFWENDPLVTDVVKLGGSLWIGDSLEYPTLNADQWALTAGILKKAGIKMPSGS